MSFQPPCIAVGRFGWVYDALLVRLLAGGNWSNASMCRSQSANANNFGANVNPNISGRGASDTCRRESITPIRLDVTALPCGKIPNGGVRALCGLEGDSLVSG